MKTVWFLAGVLFITAVVAASIFNIFAKKDQSTSPTINYFLPLGDSYTIGEKVPSESSWPKLLVKDLNEHGIKTLLVANPARSGWSSQDLIDKELPILRSSNTSFVTILIGTNDIVQGVNSEVFEKNLITILDTVQDKLLDSKKVILFTLPDFTITPTGKEFVNNNTRNQILEYNRIINLQADKRGLPMVDLFPLSQNMEGDYSLMARDWLHPSAAEYQLWEKMIYPLAFKLLRP